MSDLKYEKLVLKVKPDINEIIPDNADLTILLIRGHISGVPVRYLVHSWF
jgi:hypothetical protein